MLTGYENQITHSHKFELHNPLQWTLFLLSARHYLTKTNQWLQIMTWKIPSENSYCNAHASKNISTKTKTTLRSSPKHHLNYNRSVGSAINSGDFQWEISRLEIKRKKKKRMIAFFICCHVDVCWRMSQRTMTSLELTTVFQSTVDLSRSEITVFRQKVYIQENPVI